MTIANVDEQIRQNFEHFCVRANMNKTTAFSALVKIAVTINEQGLLLTPISDAGQRQGKTKSQLQKEALKEFRLGVKEITDEPIDDEFRSIVRGGRPTQEPLALAMGSVRRRFM